jgi:hypothetical protein
LNVISTVREEFCCEKRNVPESGYNFLKIALLQKEGNELASRILMLGGISAFKHSLVFSGLVSVLRLFIWASAVPSC